MTATVTPIRTNGKRQPVRVEIDRHELVGDLLDMQALVSEAMDANGYSLQTVLRLPAGPWRTEMQSAHHTTHDRLTALLARLRDASGHYDGKPERA